MNTNSESPHQQSPEDNGTAVQANANKASSVMEPLDVNTTTPEDSKVAVFASNTFPEVTYEMLGESSGFNTVSDLMDTDTELSVVVEDVPLEILPGGKETASNEIEMNSVTEEKGKIDVEVQSAGEIDAEQKVPEEIDVIKENENSVNDQKITVFNGVNTISVEGTIVAEGNTTINMSSTIEGDAEPLEDLRLYSVDEVLGFNSSGPLANEFSPEVQIIEPDESAIADAFDKRKITARSLKNEALLTSPTITHTRRPRRVIFDSHIPPNEYEGVKHGLKLPKFNGMGTHEIVQRMADRGHILFIEGSLRWVGPTSAEKRTWMSMISEDGTSEFDDDEEDMTVGGPLEIYEPMTVSPVNTPKWRYRKKRSKGGEVDPSSIVPNSVSSSLGSTGSASETELGTDEDEDDAELASQGWIVTKAEGAETPLTSPVPSQEVEYELIEEPEFVMESEEPVVEGPPQKKRKQKHEPQPHTDGKIYPKPGFSYSCLIAMSLKNSRTGSLPVSEIYKFMCDHFPYFKSAPSGWKNSVRHNLSLNKCFEKVEKPGGNATRKGCLWGLCAGKVHKMDEEVQKWLKKDPASVLRAMSDPENLELIERGELKRDYSGNNAGASDDEDEEEDAVTPIRTGLPATARNTKVRQATAVTTTVVGGETIIHTTPVTMSQIRASLQPQQIRVINQHGEEQITVTDDQKQTIDLAQLGSVQGNYLCHSNGTFTLSFTGLGNQSTTPLIIRRTPVK